MNDINDSKSIHSLLNEIEERDKEIESLKNLIHELSGVLCRLERYNYIGYEIDDEQREQCDHWRDIGRQAVERSRKLIIEWNK